MTNRNEATREIKALLKQITGTTWNCSGSRGTAWGWIKIVAPKARIASNGYSMEKIDAWHLALAMDPEARRPVHHQYESISPEARDGFVENLRVRAAAGHKVSREQAEAKLAECNVDAGQWAEATASDLVRQHGANVPEWKIDQEIGEIAHRRGGSRDFVADKLRAEIAERQSHLDEPQVAASTVTDTPADQAIRAEREARVAAMDAAANDETPEATGLDPSASAWLALAEG